MLKRQEESQIDHLLPFAHCRLLLPNLPNAFGFASPCLGMSCISITCMVLCLFAVYQQGYKSQWQSELRTELRKLTSVKGISNLEIFTMELAKIYSRELNENHILIKMNMKIPFSACWYRSWSFLFVASSFSWTALSFEDLIFWFNNK